MKFNGSGIAAVVAPNGFGKSNLSDAISWVLGEQSARMLRGERMVDVIFNGTGTRPPTGLAGVSLTLIDPGYVSAPAEAAKLEVIESPLANELQPSLIEETESSIETIHPEIPGSNG